MEPNVFPYFALTSRKVKTVNSQACPIVFPFSLVLIYYVLFMLYQLIKHILCDKPPQFLWGKHSEVNTVFFRVSPVYFVALLGR